MSFNFLKYSYTALMLIMFTFGSLAQSGSGTTLDFASANTANVATTGNSLSSLSFPCTFMFWLKVDNGPTVQPIISTATSTTGYQGINIKYLTTNGTIQVTMGNNTTFNLGSVKALIGTVGTVTNQWFHVAITFSSSGQGTLFINGSARTSTNIGPASLTPLFPASGTTRLGYGYDQSAEHYEGNIDEMSVWNRVLPLTQIRDYMCEKLSGNEPGLQAYWRFDGTGNTINDLSNNGVNLSLAGTSGVSRTISGVPLGDFSNYTYNLGNVSISSPQGVTVTGINGTGGSDGVHLYYIGQHPDQDLGVGSLCDTIGHFGRFIATNPTQPNIPGLITITPAMSLIYVRPSSNEGTWNTTPVTQNLFFSNIRQEFLFDPAQFPVIDMDRIPACDSSTITAPNILGASYSWSTGASTRTITTPAPGEHWVTISTNCASVTDTFEVYRDTIFAPLALADSAFYCPNDSVNVIAYNITAVPAIDSVMWSDGLTGRSRPAYQTGWLKAYVALTGSCWTVDSIYVAETSQSFSLGADTVICGGEQLPLTVPAGATNIVWNDGSSGSTLFVDQLGTYFVSFEVNGCNLGDTIQVGVLNFNISAPEVVSICTGETANLSFSANVIPDSVYWSTGETTISISTTTVGKYWVEAFRGNCYDSDTLEVEVLDGVNSTVPQLRTLCTGESMELRLEGVVPDSYIENIVWSDGSVGDSLIIAAGGTYVADGISPCGPYSVQFLVDEVRCEIWIFIPTAFSPNGDGVNDAFTMSLNGLETFRFEVFDRWGNRVFLNTDPDISWDGNVNGNPVQEGIYAYRLVGQSFSGEAIERSGSVQILR